MSEQGRRNDGDKQFTPDEILRAIAGDGDSPVPSSSWGEKYREQFQAQSIESQFEYVHLKGAQEHYRHKGKWSWLLMLAIAGMLIFQAVLLFMVGSGKLDFTAYEWLLPALLVQNLAQVIGLAVYAVRYLFSDISGQTMNKSR